MGDVYDYLIDFFDIYGDNSINKYVAIEQYPEDYAFYNDDTDYGVFIKIDYIEKYHESCSGITLETRSVTIDGIICKGYILKCNVSDVKPQFSMVASDLLHTDRSELLVNPSEWFDKWKEILGNATVLHSTYPVIGELVILKDLINHGYDAQWNGPDGSVCDIVSPAAGMYFEVKSTIVRNGHSVTLSEEFQAKKADYLCFCRFEEDANGEYSINSICSELAEMGYDRKKLESGCRKLGIIDTSLLTKRYHLLELAYYPVEGNLPDITKMFVGGIKPSIIEKISYTINLSSLIRLENIPVFTNNT